MQTGAEKMDGGCVCGAVRYRCGPPREPPTICHCESCRRASGAHCVTWLTVTADSLQFTAGKPRWRQSSAGVRRGFCGDCGTPLSYENVSRTAEVDIALCTLDAPGLLAPLDHIWMSDALSWDRPRTASRNT